MSKSKKLSRENINEVFSGKITLATENERNRQKAIDSMHQAKEIEADKLKKGFKWMGNGKTSILTHPDNVKEKLELGYRFV